MIPLLAVHVLEQESFHDQLPAFEKRLQWFRENRRDQLQHISNSETRGVEPHRVGLLALPTRDRLTRALGYLLDEKEFLSPFGIRSLSAIYRDKPYVFQMEGDDRKYTVGYVPGDMDGSEFGGNSNWRGPIWMPINYLLIEALREYHRYFGDEFQVECPSGSGKMMNLAAVAEELARRLATLFLPAEGRPRPCHGSYARYAEDPHWKDHILFYEYFDGDTGRGLGASHQTGWTALVACLLEDFIPRTKA